MRHVTEYISKLNFGIIRELFLIFKIAPVAKQLKANEHNSLLVAQKCSLGK